MADTPEKLPTSALPSHEAQKESPHSLEKYLLELEKRLETARTDKERRDYSELVEKLKAELANRSEQAKDATTGSIAEFKAGLSPEKKKLLSDVESGMSRAYDQTKEGLTAAKDKAVDAVGKTAEKLGGKEAAAALKAGDAQAAAAAVGEKLAGVGAAAQMVVGLEQAAREIEEQLPFFGAFIAAIIRALSGVIGFFVPTAEKDKLDELKKKGQNLAKKATDVKEEAKSSVDRFANMDSKERKEVLEKITGSFAKDLSQKYFAGAELTPDHLNRLRSIVTESFDVESLQKLAKKIYESGEISIGDAADLIGQEAFSASKFAWKLAWSGIVPVYKLAYKSVSDVSGTMVSVTLEGLGIGSSMKTEELPSFLSKYAESGGEYARDLARLEMYRPLGVFWAVVWGMTAGMGGMAAMMTDTATGANGLDVGKNLLKKDYLKVAEEFRKVEATLGLAAGNSPSSAMVELGEQMKRITRDWEIIAIAKEVGHDKEKFLAHPKAKELLGADFQKVVSSPKLDMALQQVINGPVSREVSLKNLNMMLANSETAVVSKYARELDEVQKFQQQLARLDEGGWKKVEKPWQMLKSLKVIRQADTVVLHLENADDVQKLKSINALWPEGLRGFFKSLPAASFAVTMSSALSEGQGVTDVIKTAVGVLTPIYGSWQLIKNVKFSWKDLQEGKVPSLADAAVASLWTVLLVSETVRITGWLWQAGVYTLKEGEVVKGLKMAGKTVGMHAIDLANASASVVRGFNHAKLATPAVYNQLAKSLAVMAARTAESPVPVKRGYKVAGAAALVAAAMVVGKMYHDADSANAELVESGFLDKEGKLTSKFEQAFASFDTQKKKSHIDGLFGAVVDRDNRQPKTYLDPATGEYSIIAEKSTERDYWQKVLNTDGAFRSQIRKLGLDIRVIAREEVEAAVKAETVDIAA